MKEYGGYIEFEHYTGKHYHQNAIPLNTGRNCLRYLIRAKKIKHIAMPRFICSAVTNVCKNEGVRITYYFINRELKPIGIEEFDEGTYLYIVNYYGLLDTDYVTKLACKYRVILDNSQAFFESAITGIDTIYTCRKFFGVADGAYLITDSRIDEHIEVDTSYDRMAFLFGRYEVDASTFYPAFRQNEQRLDTIEIRYMSKITQNILRNIDYNYIKNIRNQNYCTLNNTIGKNNLLRTQKPIVGPYMYPFLINNGNYLRTKLKEKNIYVPVLWPNILETEKCESYEYYFADNILPLPCDQRYSTQDMLYIANTIDYFLQEGIK